MAVIYKGIEKKLAKMEEVQDDLHGRAEVMAAAASADLAEHFNDRAEVHAEIEIAHGDIDWYVVLVHPAAMTIEFGRKPNDRGRGGMAGLHILQRATHFQKKG